MQVGEYRDMTRGLRQAISSYTSARPWERPNEREWVRRSLDSLLAATPPTRLTAHDRDHAAGVMGEARAILTTT